MIEVVKMVEYEISPKTFTVPLSPDYCPAVMLWHETLIPVFYFSRIFLPNSGQTHTKVGVLAYQDKPGSKLNYLAISLGDAPYKVTISDEQQIEPGEQYSDKALLPLVLSCFEIDNIAIPILNVPYLASDKLKKNLLKM